MKTAFIAVAFILLCGLGEVCRAQPQPQLQADTKKVSICFDFVDKNGNKKFGTGTFSFGNPTIEVPAIFSVIALSINYPDRGTIKAEPYSNFNEMLCMKVLPDTYYLQAECWNCLKNSSYIPSRFKIYLNSKLNTITLKLDGTWQ